MITSSDRRQANKASKLAAEWRSTLRIMKHSAKITGKEYHRAKRECTLNLAQGNLIYPPSLKALGLYEGMPLPLRKEALGANELAHEPTEAELEFQDMLATQGRKNVKSNWIWRIGQECVEKAQEGWYGFFVTLTVDPSRCPDSRAMWQEGREFRKYMEKLAKVASKACGMPRAIHNGASVRDFVHHVGVIEHGKSNQHHHMHLLIWMRDIPASWKQCPNKGIREPRYRINDWCRPMATYWPLSLPGIGRAKYFRHEGDMWSRHGFVLPYDPKKNGSSKSTALKKRVYMSPSIWIRMTKHGRTG